MLLSTTANLLGCLTMQRGSGERASELSMFEGPHRCWRVRLPLKARPAASSTGELCRRPGVKLGRASRRRVSLTRDRFSKTADSREGAAVGEESSAPDHPASRSSRPGRWPASGAAR